MIMRPVLQLPDKLDNLKLGDLKITYFEGNTSIKTW